PRALPALPTRRSSDLSPAAAAQAGGPARRRRAAQRDEQKVVAEAAAPGNDRVFPGIDVLDLVVDELGAYFFQQGSARHPRVLGTALTRDDPRQRRAEFEAGRAVDDGDADPVARQAAQRVRGLQARKAAA